MLGFSWYKGVIFSDTKYSDVLGLEELELVLKEKKNPNKQLVWSFW